MPTKKKTTSGPKATLMKKNLAQLKHFNEKEPGAVEGPGEKIKDQGIFYQEKRSPG